MKVNILQFENAELQQLHAKAATVANGEVVEGPFVGKWWEHYLSVVIETAQAEQRVACSKDVAEIRGYYDLMARKLDAAITERDDLRNELTLSTARENEDVKLIAELRADVAALANAGLHDVLAQPVINPKIESGDTVTIQGVGEYVAGTPTQTDECTITPLLPTKPNPFA